MSETAETTNADPTDDWLPRLRKLVELQTEASKALRDFEAEVPIQRRQLEAAVSGAQAHITGYLEGKGVTVEEANARLKE